MCKKNFENAVIMNEESMFLCKENDGTYYWRPCTNTAVLFPTNIAAEDFLKTWNKENPKCRLSGVRIATAPSEEGIPICSQEGRNTTMDPNVSTTNEEEEEDDEIKDDYSQWERQSIIEEIEYRGLEEECDVDEYSTEDLRNVLRDDDNKTIDDEDDDEEEDDYDDMSRDEIIDIIYDRGLEDKCDVDEDSTEDLRNVLRDDDNKTIDDEDDDEEEDDYDDMSRDEIIDIIYDRGLEDKCDVDEDSTEYLREVLRSDDDNEEECEPCEKETERVIEKCKEEIRKAAELSAKLDAAKKCGDRKTIAVMQMNLGKIKKDLKNKTKDCNPDMLAKFISAFLG